jgi:molybdate transport system substrate-binding protein
LTVPIRRSRLASLTAVAVLALLALLAGSASSATPWTHAAARAQITVYAAASLTDVFPAIAPNEKYSFAGSNALATQITQGATADVFASANMTLPQGLNQKGLCSKPVVFTRNTLVVVVPKSNPAHIHNIYDLTKPGVKIDIAASGVPVGTYTLQVLSNMNLKAAVLKNVVSQETDVREVLAKVALGEADAGFVYSTDAKTVAGKVNVIKVPAWAQPKVQYGICVVSKSADKPAAQAFIKLVLSKAGQKKLHKFGFLARVKPTPKKHHPKKHKK